MTKLKIVATAIICLAFATSCTETAAPITASKIPNGLSGLIAEQTSLATQKFVATVEPRKPLKIVGKQGTEVTFRNLWDKTIFTEIKGNVDVELIEIYDLADFALLNKPTLAEDVNSLKKEKQILESAGSFFVSVKQNGKKIYANYNLSSRPKQAINRDMMVFIGFPNTANAEFSWVSTGRKAAICADSMRLGTYCIDFIGSPNPPNWTNLDRYIFSNGTNSELKVQLANNFNETNTKVYFNIVGLKVLIPLSYANNIFNSGGAYQLQQGLDINIIVIAEDKGELKYAIQRTKTQTNGVENITNLAPISIELLKQKINAL
jgi:hypothetical protein